VGTPGKLYWVLTCVAYLLGLVATFISLFLMNAAQPVSFLTIENIYNIEDNPKTLCLLKVSC
jgi:hypothetical protein